MSPLPSYYELLGIPREATPEEIRHAYHNAARKLHPDVKVEQGGTEFFLHIQEAYSVLSDPEKRKAYDEELISESEKLVITDVQYSRSALGIIDEPQLIYALIDFLAPEDASSSPNPPLNICLVIDRSTSMQGRRMDTVKTAAIELIRRLKSQDLLSIVVFSDRAELLLPAGHKTDRKIIESQIRMIKPGGGTEIFQGLETGFLEVRRNSTQALVNHIILITDGRTYGDEDDCLQLASKAATQGVRFTGLGLGTDWNDVFLDELTARTGGSSFFVSKVNDIHSFLQEKFASLNQVYAERVVLRIKTPKSVKLNSAFRLEPDSAILPIDNYSIRLGSIPKTSKVSLLLEFIISPIPVNTQRVTLGTGDLNLVLPINPAAKSIIPVSLSRLTSDTPFAEMPPRPIFQALTRITLYRMQERARQEVAEGKVQEASLRLQRLATQLLSLGEDELAQTAFTESERIQQTHMLSAEGEKRIKYGTRSLLLPARTDKV